MNAGKLRCRVTFQRRAAVTNTMGEALTWTNVLTTWASIEALRTKMFYQTADFVADSTYIIKLRHPGNITLNVSDRLTYNSLTFELQALTNVKMRNKELHILAHIINEQN